MAVTYFALINFDFLNFFLKNSYLGIYEMKKKWKILK